MSIAAPHQIAMLTGQSDRSRCALSPVQEEFLEAVALPESMRVASNFPYLHGSATYRPSPLITASVNNTWLYFWSRTRTFRLAYADRVRELIERRQRTLFVAGSCGLELFNNLQLPEDLLRRVSIFAFGPVARRRPRCAHVLVGSPRDSLSIRCFPSPDHLVDSGHMSYLTRPDVRTLCREFLSRVVYPVAEPVRPA